MAGAPDAKPVLFYDNFESGNTSSTNDTGFKWGQNNRTSVVTMDEQGPVVVWNNGKVSNRPTGKVNWQAHDGKHALRFRYPAGEAMAEQRFDLGKACPELWLRFWLKVPENFQHASNGTRTNNKLLALWMDDYEFKGNGPTVVWQFRRSGDGASQNTVYHVATAVGQSQRHSGEHSGQVAPFVTVPDDRGKWMQVVFRVVAASDAQSRDGVIQMWRRWDKEDAFTQLFNITDAMTHIPEGGPAGFRYGYLLGWANASYTNTTEWLLDGFTVSEHSLLQMESNPKVDSEVRP